MLDYYIYYTSEYRWHKTSVVVRTGGGVDDSERDGVRHRLDVLNIKQRLHAAASLADLRVVATNSHLYIRSDTAGITERLQISVVIYNK